MNYCVGCMCSLHRGYHRSLIEGATRDMMLCSTCFAHEERTARQSNCQPILIAMYKENEQQITIKVKQQAQAEAIQRLKRAIDDYWEMALAGDVLLTIPEDAKISSDDASNRHDVYVQINRHPSKFVEFACPASRPLRRLKVFLPNTVQPGDTIRIKRPSKSGRSYVGVIVEYAKD